LEEETMAKIRHIALTTGDPSGVAAFYKEAFGLEEIRRSDNGAVFLSDGYINLAILRSNDQGNGESPRDLPGYAGIDHLGFVVEDVDAATKKLEEEGATAMGRLDLGHPQPDGGRSYYELKFRGPDNQVIDISGAGWIGT
jgi:catechol 2,3-dioxygenase-like lactoylglutathione lyase family enzyme